MSNYLARLSNLQNDIRVGIVGIGSIGKGMIFQAILTPGIRCVAIADIDLDKAISWVDNLPVSYEVVNSLTEMHSSMRQKKNRCMSGWKPCGSMRIVRNFYGSHRFDSQGMPIWFESPPT